MDLERKFPCVADMEAATPNRIPRFAYDYMHYGIGTGACLANNRQALNNIKLVPRYLVDDADDPDCSHSVLGQDFSYPFGVAPIGLGGLIWPGAAEALATAARKKSILFCLSGFATASIEDIGKLSEGRAWYQHYLCVDNEINKTLLNRALDCGYRTLVITVDIPTTTRKTHDMKNGLSVPPRFNPGTVLDILSRPRWALETLKLGIPEFVNLKEFYPKNANLDEISKFLQDIIEGHVSVKRLEWVRDNWPHNLIVKGILDPKDAIASKKIGVDGISISNHGGRQLDAAHSAIERIDIIRQAVGNDLTLLVDGGVRCGLDITRCLAVGADFVLAGRPFMYALGAMGIPGADHIMHVLSDELRGTMRQIGCPNVSRLPGFLGKD